MPSYVVPKKNTEFIFYASLISQANTKVFQTNPTLAAGDVKVSTDGGAEANITTLPAVTPAGSKRVKVTVSATEMNGDNVQITFSDAAGSEWCDLTINLQTATRQIDDLAFPTTSGRSVDVTATGAVGIDWANVESPTTTLNLSGTTIATTQKVDVETIKTNPVANAGTVTFPTNATLASTTNITAGTITTATNVTTVNGLAANVITAAAIAADAIGASELAADAVAEIADQVWDELIVGHLGAGSTGAALNAAGSAGDPWSTPLPGAYGAGTAGHIIGTALPDIAAGSAGGLLIAGSNAATTFATLTVSGATTLTGNVSMAAGLTITQSTGNASAVSITGNGTGHGLSVTSGSGATGNGIHAVSAATNGNGFNGLGTGTGNGMLLTGGVAGDGDGLHLVSTGAGVGIRSQGNFDITGEFTTSGTTRFNALTVTNALTISGTTTLTGAIAATNASNDIRGVKLAATGLASVTAWTVDITGNITGNLSGSVGSVTGAVGSVTGNVTGSIGSLATQAKADVNAEVVDCLNTDTYAQPGQGTPAATTTIVSQLGYLYKTWRNKTTQTATTFSVYNDDTTTVDQKATCSDDTTTFTKGEIATGP